MMKWSIFDEANQATLNEVREKYGVTTERLNELRGALVQAKRKIEHGNLQVQPEQLSQAIAALKKAVENTRISSRRDALTVFNSGDLKTKFRSLMQTGLNVAYVDAVNDKMGAIKVYKFETDKSGRIRLFAATPDNPNEVEGSGLYSVAIIDSSKSKTSAKTFRPRTHSTRAVATTGGRKPRKPRISFEHVIKA
jgi:hypothetical protein